MSLGIHFQIWLSFLCQAFENHSFPDIQETHSTVKIISVNQKIFKSTLTSAQEISGVKLTSEPVIFFSLEPVSFLSSELHSFTFSTDKAADSTILSSKPSAASVCLKTSEHHARNFKKPIQSTTEKPPGCEKQQPLPSVFPDFEQLYQEFCNIFLWDHIHERTSIKLDNSSGAQSFLSLATIPSKQNINLSDFDPANPTKPNFAVSQQNSKPLVVLNPQHI